MIRKLLICAFVFWAQGALAEGPTEPTVRPLGRGEVIPLRPTARPFLRPDLARGVQTQPIYRAERGLFAFSPNAIRLSLCPTRRPSAIEQAAEARRVARVRGQVRGDPNIQGEEIGRINGRGACGVESAVRIKSVADVRMIPQPTVGCRTASALRRWVVNGAKPAVGSAGGGIASMGVVSHYAGRNRNLAASGWLSEHAFGRAIDIAGIKLKSGREITVLRGWNTAGDGARLRKMWRTACGPFGTVLGPKANRFHADHFHFDTARYRSGSYCR